MKAVTATNTYFNITGIASNDVNNRLIIYIESCSSYTVAQFQAWLASNPITVYYELATPETITITKPPVSTYEGINYITTTNNVKPTLTIEAWKK